MHAYILTYMHTCIHTYIHTYMHTHLHTHMHTYIHPNPMHVQMKLELVANCIIRSFLPYK